MSVHPIQLKPENSENVAGRWVTNEMLWRTALYFAGIGQPVFPCCPWPGAFLDWQGEPIGDKAPLVRHGFHDATTDENQIKKWWEQYPFAMIGGPVPRDETCLDLDPRKGADIDILYALVTPELMPITRTVVSGRLDGG